MDRHFICLSFKTPSRFFLFLRIFYWNFPLFRQCDIYIFFIFFYFITVDMPQHDLHRIRNNAIMSTSNIVCLVIRIMIEERFGLIILVQPHHVVLRFLYHARQGITVYVILDVVLFWFIWRLAWIRVQGVSILPLF